MIFVNKLLKSFNPVYNRVPFARRFIRKFLRFYAYFFLKRNTLIVYGSLIESISVYLGFKVKTKMFILDNKSVPASFIAKFIATGLKLKYNYLDMIIPIRKNLKKQMFLKR
jgi:hypothetical protein